MNAHKGGAGTGETGEKDTRSVHAAGSLLDGLTDGQFLVSVASCQFPIPPSLQTVRLPDSIPSVLADGQRDRGTGRQGTEVRHHRH